MSLNDFLLISKIKDNISEEKKKLGELVQSYFRTKYIVNLIKNALMELKKLPDGARLYAIIKAIYFEKIKAIDLEDHLAQEGYYMCQATAYNINKAAINTLSVFLWGYDYENSNIIEDLFEDDFKETLSRFHGSYI